MNWRDLFYFSKGERRALTLLLLLITISWILLLWTDKKPESVASETSREPIEYQSAPDEKQAVFPQDTLKKSPSNPSAYTSKPKTPFPHRRLQKSYTPYARTEKFTEGTVIELNTADTTTLKKVPGIGTSFARRIVKYRELLGGFYTVEQLAEVYGMDEERYSSLVTWFRTDTAHIRKIPVNRLQATDLRKHPYIDYRQAKVIEQLRKRKGILSGWENLRLLEEFTEFDRERLTPYLSFE